MYFCRPSRTVFNFSIMTTYLKTFFVTFYTRMVKHKVIEFYHEQYYIFRSAGYADISSFLTTEEADFRCAESVASHETGFILFLYVDNACNVNRRR